MVIKNTIMIQGGFYFNEDILMEKDKTGTLMKSCYLNDLRLLQTEKMLWVRLTISGQPPSPRFGHTLNISGSNLVVFGGWTHDSNTRVAQGKADDGCQGQFKILNVDKFVWEPYRFRKRLPQNRYGHTATSVGTHLVIFGGWELNRATNEVFILRNVDIQK